VRISALLEASDHLHVHKHEGMSSTGAADLRLIHNCRICRRGRHTGGGGESELVRSGMQGLAEVCHTDMVYYVDGQSSIWMLIFILQIYEHVWDEHRRTLFSERNMEDKRYPLEPLRPVEGRAMEAQLSTNRKRMCMTSDCQPFAAGRRMRGSNAPGWPRIGRRLRSGRSSVHSRRRKRCGRSRNMTSQSPGQLPSRLIGGKMP